MSARQLLSEAEAQRETRTNPVDIHLDRRQSLRSATRALDQLVRLGAQNTDADRAVRRSLAALPKWQDVEVPNHAGIQATAFSEDRHSVVFHTGSGDLQYQSLFGRTYQGNCHHLGRPGCYAGIRQPAR